MERQFIETESAPKPIGPYTQAIRAGDLVFTSGQIALNPKTGKLIEGDVAAQTRQVFENLKAVLEAAGSSLDRTVKATVYLKNMGDFAAVNQVYASYLDGAKPARSTVAAADLPAGASIEIDLIALA
jgi:2-iminobutanoate/2-iminopropanoate deaminase